MEGWEEEERKAKGINDSLYSSFSNTSGCVSDLRESYKIMEGK